MNARKDKEKVKVNVPFRYKEKVKRTATERIKWIGISVRLLILLGSIPKIPQMGL